MKPDLTFCYAADITKAERDDSGDLIVIGTAASTTMDIDRQTADAAWLQKAMPQWARWGNIREQHGKTAAGVGTELEQDGDSWLLKAAIIDQGTATKVEKGVLKGFSIGIKGPVVMNKGVRVGINDPGQIVGGEIVEISLVDRPANPDCIVDIAEKAAGGWEGVDIEKAADDKVNCPTCDGDGKIMGGKRKCPDCQGDGKVTKATADKLSKAVTPEMIKALLANTFGLDEEDTDRIPENIIGFLGKRDYSTKERKAMAKSGQAMPGGGFPIKTKDDVANAVQAIGRAKDPAAAKDHIKKRAAALGASKLTENLKSVVADLTKADDDTWTHDPAQLAAVRNGLAQLMQAELDELMAGEPEIWDIQDLTVSLQTFLNWWSHEAYEGEVPPPGPSDEGDDMDLITLGVNPDLIKAAEATDATPEAKAAVVADLKKQLGIDTTPDPELLKGVVAEATKGLKDEIEALRGTVAPGGPVTTRTNAQAEKTAVADTLKAEAARYRTLAESVDDRNAAQGYRNKAADCEARAAKLAAPDAVTV